MIGDSVFILIIGKIIEENLTYINIKQCPVLIGILTTLLQNIKIVIL